MLRVNGDHGLPYVEVGLGITTSGDGPDPNLPPIPTLTPPTCAWNIPAGSRNTNFGTVTAGNFGNAPGTGTYKDGPIIPVNVSCVGSAQGAAAADATVYATTDYTAVNGQNFIDFKTSDGNQTFISLSLMMPASTPADVTLSGGVSPGVALPYNGAGQARPWFTWKLPATSGQLSTSAVNLTPRVSAPNNSGAIFLLGSARVTIKLSLVVQ